MSKKYKVYMNSWIDGVLCKTIHFFKKLKKAIDFAKRNSLNTFKIYDWKHNLIRSINCHDHHGTYA